MEGEEAVVSECVGDGGRVSWKLWVTLPCGHKEEVPPEGLANDDLRRCSACLEVDVSDIERDVEAVEQAWQRIIDAIHDSPPSEEAMSDRPPRDLREYSQEIQQRWLLVVGEELEDLREEFEQHKAFHSADAVARAWEKTKERVERSSTHGATCHTCGQRVPNAAP